MTMREDFVANAVQFLRDPVVQQSPLTKKVAFLEAKQLTKEEIDEALARSSRWEASTIASGGLNPARGSFQQPSNPPPLPSRDWRDLFIMAVVTGGVSYGVYFLTKVSLRSLLLTR